MSAIGVGTVVTYRGKRLEELTREELVDAVRQAVSEIEMWKEQAARYRRMRALFQAEEAAS